MKGHAFEVIIVDDNSEDRTWEIAQELSIRHQNIHVIRRIHRKGLSSAVLEGFLLAKGSFLVAMDADFQHDVHLIPEMLKEVGRYDFVVGSRYLHGGSVKGWNLGRRLMSRFSVWLARRRLRKDLTDPMSGFFMVHRSLVHQVAPRLQAQGFKILFELLLRCPEARVKELPYHFGVRRHGASKLDTTVVLDFADLLLSNSRLSRMNPQFLRYAVVGASGVAIHYFILYLLYRRIGWHYAVSLMIAIEVAMTSNYIWNNQWTFARQRFLKSKWWNGFLRYHLACSMGSLYNLAVAWYLVARGWSWVLASGLGIWIGVSWNYLANKSFTWRE